MPFYDYKCHHCAKVFEALHAMGAKPVDLSCQFCGSVEVKRVFAAVGTMKSGAASPGTSAPTAAGCTTCSSGACSTCH